MLKIVFLLGRPGAGKSTLAQYIETLANRRGWATQHFYDYKYLQDMFQQDIGKQFKPTASGGFDVLDFTVLDTALVQMAKELPREISIEVFDHSEENKLFLIEFARKEYDRALHIFGYDILRNARLLYVKLDLETCIKRVQERANIRRLRSEYDHYVSEEIMRDYYSGDDWLDGQISEYLDYLQRDLVHVSLDEVDNSGTYDELEEKVKEIVDLLISEDEKVKEIVDLPVTELVTAP